jgi:HD-GYP domain-containing protein (c-di-GMP phosphodiesterase class II)
MVRKHPITSAEMIKDVAFLSDCVPFVRHHHERWDGTGYPDGLRGEEIPDGARILCVADCLDAMTTQHSYAPAKTLDEALEDMISLAGSQFDPAIVAAVQGIWINGRLGLVQPGKA